MEGDGEDIKKDGVKSSTLSAAKNVSRILDRIKGIGAKNERA